MSSARTAVKGIFTGWAAVVSVVVAIVALAAGIWWFGVATSGVHGRGEQKKQVNNSVNRTQWYTHFFDLKTAYDSQVQAARLAQRMLDDFNKDNPPGSPDPLGQNAQTRAQYRTDLTGARQQCVTTANTYNNDSLKTRVGAQFKASGLPESLDPKACED